MEPHIGEDRPREWVVVLVSLGDNIFTIPELMAHIVGHCAVLGEMPYYNAIFAPTLPLPGNLPWLFSVPLTL